ncbi:MAG: FMN-binding protein [Rhodothermales bacterium]|nr:FMN-binding protein [Rhodothermales bacterium]
MNGQAQTMSGKPGAPQTGGAKAGSGPGTWTMYRAMVGVGIFCGLLIVSAYEGTRPVIERKQAEALQAAIFEVLPDVSSTTTFRFDQDDAFEAVTETGAPATGEGLVYAGYDDGGKLIGVAIETQGMGYQDVIRVIYGYAFAQDAVVGLRVLETKETPGLGDKIEKDPTFLKNFERLDVSLNADGSALANPIEFVKPGMKSQPWQIDGITGATISSNATAAMLGTSTAYWVPKIRAALEDFEK